MFVGSRKVDERPTWKFEGLREILAGPTSIDRGSSRSNLRPIVVYPHFPTRQLQHQQHPDNRVSLHESVSSRASKWNRNFVLPWGAQFKLEMQRPNRDVSRQMNHSTTSSTRSGHSRTAS